MIRPEIGNLFKRFMTTASLISLLLAVGLTFKNKLLTALDLKFIPEETESTQNLNQKTVLGAESKIDEADFIIKLYNLINGYRKENHLSNLKITKTLEQSAEDKLYDMIENKYWQHLDQEQVGPWYFFTKAEYHFALAGENLAFSASSPWQVFADWQNSSAHNEQLLMQQYEDVGLAIDCQTYQSYYQTGCLVVLHLGKLK